MELKPQTDSECQTARPTERRVLVIDDNAHVARLLDDVFSGGLGFTVTVVRDASEGADVAAQHAFDVVIVDYDVGGSPGTALINNYEGKATTILFSGVDRSREVERECPRRKPDRQLVKHEFAELIAIVENLAVAA
jgi:CheY-like chemotaxis protein